LNLEKVAEILGEEVAVQPSTGPNQITALRERQKKFENWAGIAGTDNFRVDPTFVRHPRLLSNNSQGWVADHPRNAANSARHRRERDGRLPDVFEVSEGEA
jgi:hypothetical protein